MATMKSAMVGATLVVVHGTQAPADSEWSDFSNLVRDQLANIRSMIVWSDGGTPSGDQRDIARKFWEQSRSRPRLALVTLSTFAKVVGKAVEIFAGQGVVRVFDPTQYEMALDHVVGTGSERIKIKATIDDFRATVTQMLRRFAFTIFGSQMYCQRESQMRYREDENTNMRCL